MSACDCFGQTQKTVKNTSVACFACRGELSGIPRLLKAGFMYESCFPLVQADKHAPMEPMTALDQCIVAFTGNCPIDATEWTEDCKAPVYTDVIAIKQCINLPKDEAGESLFSVDDLELIDQAHNCCIRFIDQQDCKQAPAYLVEQNAGGKKA